MTVSNITPFGLTITPDSAADGNVLNMDVAALNRLVLAHKVLVLRGFEPLADDDYIRFCQSLGPLMPWDFGVLLDVKMEQSPKNHIFSSGRVELHWDGAFAADTPRINAFQCMHSSSDGVGGETLFVDTSRVIDDASEQAVSEWLEVVLSYTTRKEAHYGGAVTVRLVEDHPHLKCRVLRLIELDNEDNMDVNPVWLSLAKTEGDPATALEIVRNITQMLYQPRYMYRHRWNSGDYVLVDNHSILHGRAKVAGNSRRHLKRVHIL